MLQKSVSAVCWLGCSKIRRAREGCNGVFAKIFTSGETVLANIDPSFRATSPFTVPKTQELNHFVIRFSFSEHIPCYNGSEVPQGQNRQTSNLGQNGSKMAFFCHWLEVAQKWVQSGFRSLFLHKIDRQTHFGPTSGPLPANDKKTFLTHFCAKLIA